MAHTVNSQHLLAAKVMNGAAQTPVFLDITGSFLLNLGHILDLAFVCHRLHRPLFAAFLPLPIMNVQ